jgi:sialic acid synthase SpsE
MRSAWSEVKLASLFEVAGRKVGEGQAPYVIGEAGSNHDRSLDTALQLIDIASDAGADAVKFQLFDADALYPSGTEMWRLFRSVELPAEWLPRLAEHARARRIHFFASAFDPRSLARLTELGVPAIKIASSEATDLVALAAAAATGLPLFVSTGMCDLVDVTEAVACCLRAGNDRVALLQCVAEYPLVPERADLRVMDAYRDMFGGVVGFSDHTLGTAVPLAAVGRGAAVIEKHFTYDRSATGPDHGYALEPSELGQLVRDVRAAYAALGSEVKDLTAEERRLGRREGLYARRDLRAGATVGEDDIEERRPALGIRARYRRVVVGSRLRQDVAAGEALRWEMLARG